MIENLKPLYNNVLRPVGSLLAKLKISPNVITSIGVVFFVFTGYFIAVHKWYIAVSLGLFGSLMDGLDGLVAREFLGTSTFGGIWDSVCDRFTEVFIFAGIFIYYGLQESVQIIPMSFVFIAITGSILVSYVKARAEVAGINCNVGILQRPERLIVIATGLLLGESGLYWSLVVISVLSYATVIQRLIFVRNESLKLPQQ